MSSTTQTRLISLLLALLLSFSAAVSAIPEGYTEEVMQVRGTISGKDIAYYGTIQDFFTQFSEEYPEVEVDMNNTTVIERSQFDARYKTLDRCYGPGFEPASIAAINEGIHYLQHTSLRCGTGPRSCARVSCSYNSAIHLCNDNDFAIEADCAYVASYAQDIVDNCRRYFSNERVTGQEFDSGNFNVYVDVNLC